MYDTRVIKEISDSQAGELKAGFKHLLSNRNQSKGALRSVCFNLKVFTQYFTS